MNKYSQLKATLAITKASLIGMMRNPSSIVFSILFPIIFIAIFGILGNGGSKYDVYFDKDSDRSSALYIALDEMDSFNAKEFPDNESAISELEKGKISAIIKITQVNGKTFVDLTKSKASVVNGSIVEGILRGIINDINLKSNKVIQYASLNSTEIEGREFKQIDFILPGQLGFALLNSGIFGSAFVLISLKETLVLKRFFATPIKRINILIAEGLARLIFSTLQAALIIAVGHFFFGFTLINGIWTALSMIVIAMAGLTVFLGMGLMISSIAKDENSISPIANLFTLPQFLLGGVFFPVDVFPKWIQPFAQILPLTHLNEAMRKVAFEGAGFVDVSQNLFVLIIWSIVVYTVTAKLFKWDK